MRPGLGAQRPARYNVSLVIPAFNEEKYIGRLLESAAGQTEPFAEIIIANSGTDRTEAIALEAGAIVVPCESGNIAAARNAAAGAAQGEILVFCDADMYLSPHLLEECVDALEEGYACAVPHTIFYDSVFWNCLSWGARMLRDLAHQHGTLGIVAVWREVFEEVGGYDINCNPMALTMCREDQDFGHRVEEIYGANVIKQMPYLAATSARRFKTSGVVGLQHFDETPRRYLDAGRM